MANRPGMHSRLVAILKLGLPLVALGLLSALFLVQTDDRIGGVVFSDGDVEALGNGLRDHQSDLHRHHRGPGPLPLHRGAGGAGRGTADSGRRSPSSPGRSTCTTGRA